MSANPATDELSTGEPAIQSLTSEVSSAEGPSHAQLVTVKMSELDGEESGKASAEITNALWKPQPQPTPPSPHHLWQMFEALGEGSVDTAAVGDDWVLVLPAAEKLQVCRCPSSNVSVSLCRI